MTDRRRLRVVVLASGRGGTFAALLAAQQDGRLPIDIVALLSDKRTAPALTIAESAGIATVALRPRDYPDRTSFDRALFARVAEFAPDLVVLAGYMRVIDSSVVGAWRGRMINLHPSLLPKHPGLQTHERVLAAGDSLHGSSVHYVTAELDGGPLIAQARLPVVAGDTPETLAARLRPLERQLLIRVVEQIASGRLTLGPDAVEFDGRPLALPLQMGPGGGFAAM
ncbi:MAG TPA: phosphoribosylglycinamide formyltransferase [Rudaea sp.]|nr:phosphoribosylglycinamide formyltransferase [Rudaea sp.]